MVKLIRLQKQVAVGEFPSSVTVNPNTNLVYVTNSSNETVSVIDGKTNTVTKTVTVGALPVGVAVNPNTNLIYVTNANDNSISIIPQRLQ